ncbi:MAG: DUF1552 domain-containing protein [Rhodospirillaceae bacterium]
MRPQLDRRTVLRGTLGGAAIGVGLPVLDAVLNDNGTALAATGQPLPVVFGTWLQSMGLNPGRWVPAKTGAGFENNTELKVFDAYRDRMNVFSGMRYYLDGRPHVTHVSGCQIASTGGLYAAGQGVNDSRGDSGPSVDAVIADRIGARTRFRSLEVCFSGKPKTWSRRSGSVINASEASPAALYARIFGPDFKDPNAAEFTPDPQVMARQSVLSLVGEQRKDFVAKLGAADRVRVDEYFTALRRIEEQLALELERPQRVEACVRPGDLKENTPGTLVDDAEANAKLFAGLLSHAIACDQTHVFNVCFDSETYRRSSSAMNWHMLSHEEPIDPTLGFQKDTTWFITWANKVTADFFDTLRATKEGPGSLFDRMVILWQTDHSDARSHSLDNVPVFTFGNAGGRLKTGLHIPCPGDPVTRVSLTLQQALGVSASVWGDGSNKTTATVTEILA